jgi:4-hydroxythreonine-4-phosphate dehydrogenase
VIKPLVITTGEPAGIGPDLCISVVQEEQRLPMVFAGDPETLSQRAATLGLPLILETWTNGVDAQVPAGKSHMRLLAVPAASKVEAGTPSTSNAAYVQKMLRTATSGCLNGAFSALVTAPIHKGIINEAGVSFSGHTEFLAGITGGHPVMMLACPGLRVALATTHLPLSEVPAAITAERLEGVIRVLHNDLAARFGIERPRILVCGLNPHAGEGGHLGREEIDVIQPTLAALLDDGVQALGPFPADTLFTPKHLEKADAVLAMYHDQGLPVLKHKCFGKAVNITLGLPIVRTSVDHGTAFDLAGTGMADASSLKAAIAMAGKLVSEGSFKPGGLRI